MKPLQILLLVLVCVLGWIIYMCKKYGNPYKLIMVFGKKGSGKTTLLVKLARQHMQRGWKVYSTCPVPGAFLISPKDIGSKAFDKHSVIFADEVSLVWNNRDFKTFDKRVDEWFRLQRQRKLKVYLFSQTFDVDLKIRNQCDSMYLCQCLGGWFSYAKQIKRKIIVVEPTGETEARIADTMIISPFFFAPFGARIYTYIPHWIPYFKTDYMATPLEVMEWPQVPEIQLPSFPERIRALNPAKLVNDLKRNKAEEEEFRKKVG